MQFFDTHCHIHFPDYGLEPQAVIQSSQSAGITRLLCVGCTLEDSELGVKMAQGHENIWASVGLHPHEAHHYVDDGEALTRFTLLAGQEKVVAIGECGLDYYYNHSPKAAQVQLLEFQLDLAQKHNLPLVFHVRDAFEDFWPIFDNFKGLRGVVHSFTATTKELDQLLARGLYVGLNGIMTFTRNPEQLKAAKAVPLDRLLIETDAPFLTPVPFRGKICEPRHIVLTAEFLSKLRGEFIGTFSQMTTDNAIKLFNVNGDNYE